MGIAFQEGALARSSEDDGRDHPGPVRANRFFRNRREITMRRMGLGLLGMLFFVVGCGQDQERAAPEQEAPAEPEAVAPAEPESEPVPETAPDEFRVLFETSAGEFTVLVERSLAPHGADRFYELVKSGFYDDQRFFRVVPGFVVQWGMSGDPAVTARWANARIPDDPVAGSNVRGTLSFAATNTPGSRTTQVFVNLGNNTNLDGMGFAPFGRVVQGMEVVDAINAEYGQEPNQTEIRRAGNEYLAQEFPRLDYIRAARIVNP
jgi:peptidyl-prolyl cis-trans isomerase A (cyclophilin A)